ncbi:MAG: hypothetical protein ACK4K7_06630 [Allosphingosinicella sp.]|uniref:hypothetical protein n=1 Tax=Allosphingosinicella sp. TaxID=2823234 RepID=UPI00393FE626
MSSRDADDHPRGINAHVAESWINRFRLVAACSDDQAEAVYILLLDTAARVAMPEGPFLEAGYRALTEGASVEELGDQLEAYLGSRLAGSIDFDEWRRRAQSPS